MRYSEKIRRILRLAQSQLSHKNQGAHSKDYLSGVANALAWVIAERATTPIPEESKVKASEPPVKKTTKRPPPKKEPKPLGNTIDATPGAVPEAVA